MTRSLFSSIVFGIIFAIGTLEAASPKTREYNLTVYQFSSRINGGRGGGSKSRGDKLVQFEDEVEVGRDVIQEISEQLQEYMDPSIDPCEDFYQFACGNFGHVRSIPDHLGSYGEIAQQQDRINDILKDLLNEEPDDEDNEDSFEALSKIKLFYQSCLDEEQRQRRGIQPLLDLIELFGGWHVFDSKWSENKFDWIDVVGKMASYNVKVFFDTGIVTDVMDPESYVVTIDQAYPFPLPQPEAEVNMQILKTYKEFIEDVLVLMEVPPEQVSQIARDVFEVGLQLSRLEEHKFGQIDKDVLRITLEELHRKMPAIDWQRYLWIVYGNPMDPQQVILLQSAPFFYKLPELLHGMKTKSLSNFIFWKLTEYFLDFLDDRFVEAKLKLEEDLSGSKKVTDPSDTLLQFISNKVSRPLASVYIRQYFTRQNKQDSLELAKEIRDAFKSIIREKDWLDETTKIHALKKLNNLNIQTGYPGDYMSMDKINRDYEDLHIVPDKCFENALNSEQFAHKEVQKLLGKKVTKNNWQEVTPTSVNAYYIRGDAKVIIPAGLLQPPFYHRRYPKALNYGSVGTLIGHEIAHGFDRHGRMFDESGKLLNSWSNSSILSFEKRLKCFVDQYNHYTVHGEHVAGQTTEDENVSDLAGIRAAFRAYKRWMDRNRRYRGEQTLPESSLSGEQLFFLHYAHFWCGLERREESHKMIQTDVHAPHKFRVIGPLSNSKEFAKAFKCRKGSFMNPEEKCSLW